MGNLAVTVKNQALIARQGGLVPLLAQLKSVYASCREASARTLYRLATHTSNQKQMVDAGAVAPLVSLLSDPTESPAVQRSAVMALCNLASNAQNEGPLVKAGILRPLIALVRRSARGEGEGSPPGNEKIGGSPPEQRHPPPHHLDDDCARYAAMAICNLTTHSANQLLVVEYDGLRALIALANNTSGQASAYAAMALANVSIHRLNRLKVVEAGALRPLLAMAHSPHLERQRSAALALYNVSCASLNQLKLVEAEATRPLISLASSADVDSKVYAVMALCNLTANVDTRIAASRGGGLQALVRAAADTDVGSRRYASIALCNLACDRESAIAIVVHGGLRPLLAQTGSGSNMMNNQSSMARSESSTRDFIPPQDEAGCRYALMALSNLAANEANHKTMLAKGVLETALHFGAAADPELRQIAAFALANFAANAEHCATIGERGGVSPLVALAHAEDSNAHTLAIASLRRMCQLSSDNRARIVREGGLVPLVAAGFR